ncbi:MAG: hypothetical protein JW709_07085 [Sedimentisphaerales bacterium]|nr:hypothetical protein [Sedimentisphaerales bacterium]
MFKWVLFIGVWACCWITGCSHVGHQVSPAACPAELLAARPVTVLCYGDSITAGGREHNWPDLLQRNLDRSAEGEFCVINRGQSGDTSVGAFYRMKDHVLPAMPAIVLIEFGINDAHSPYWGGQSRVGLDEYIRKMTGICQAVRAAGGYPVLIVNHPIIRPDLNQVQGDEARVKKVTDTWTRPGDGRSPTKTLAAYNQAVREIAARLGVATIDLPELTAKHHIEPQAMLGDDGIHLTPEGFALYAEMVGEELMVILNRE